LDEKTIEKIKSAFLELPKDSFVFNKLRKYGWFDIVSANDSLYEIVQKLYNDIILKKP
jgi:ABC-type phosphate/phosphonate transport system substrate-binding protein